MSPHAIAMMKHRKHHLPTFFWPPVPQAGRLMRVAGLLALAAWCCSGTSAEAGFVMSADGLATNVCAGEGLAADSKETSRSDSEGPTPVNHSPHYLGLDGGSSVPSGAGAGGTVTSGSTGGWVAPLVGSASLPPSNLVSHLCGERSLSIPAPPTSDLLRPPRA